MSSNSTNGGVLGSIVPGKVRLEIRKRNTTRGCHLHQLMRQAASQETVRKALAEFFPEHPWERIFHTAGTNAPLVIPTDPEPPLMTIPPTPAKPLNHLTELEQQILAEAAYHFGIDGKTLLPAKLPGLLSKVWSLSKDMAASVPWQPATTLRFLHRYHCLPEMPETLLATIPFGNGETILQARLKQDLTQKEVARRVSEILGSPFTPDNLSRIEMGKSPSPFGDRLTALAMVLGYTEAQLAGEPEDLPEPTITPDAPVKEPMLLNNPAPSMPGASHVPSLKQGGELHPAIKPALPDNLPGLRTAPVTHKSPGTVPSQNTLQLNLQQAHNSIEAALQDLKPVMQFLEEGETRTRDAVTGLQSRLDAAELRLSRQAEIIATQRTRIAELEDAYTNPAG